DLIQETESHGIDRSAEDIELKSILESFIATGMIPELAKSRRDKDEDKDDGGHGSHKDGKSSRSDKDGRKKGDRSDNNRLI
ncbi:hypothetical protein ACR2XN_28925, partial [Klebsiella pneumoniae]